jgi:hypothetical protein
VPETTYTTKNDARIKHFAKEYGLKLAQAEGFFRTANGNYAAAFALASEYLKAEYAAKLAAYQEAKGIK